MQFIQKAYTLRIILRLIKTQKSPQEKTNDLHIQRRFSMRLLPTITALGLLVATSAAVAADPNLPRNLAATCANCHGTNGNAIKGAGLDSLAGIPKDKTLQKLADFKSGDKPASIMHQIAKGYTEEQLDLIATYFAAQK
jgi:cytochrome c553